MFSIFKSVARLFKKSKKNENYKDKINDDTDKINKLFDLAMKSACRGEITIKCWPNGGTLKLLTENKVVKGKEIYYNQCIRCLDEKYKEIENKEIELQKHLSASDGKKVGDFSNYWDEFNKYLIFLCSSMGCCIYFPDPHPEDIKEKLFQNYLCESCYRSGKIKKLDQNRRIDYESRISEHIVYQSKRDSLESVDSLEKLLRFHVGNFSDSQNKFLLNFANSFNIYLEKASEANAKNAANDLSKIYKNFSEVGVSSRSRFWNKQLKKAVDAYRVCIDNHLKKCEEFIDFYLENLENEVVNLGLTFSQQWPGESGEFEKFDQFKQLTATLDTKIKKLEEISNDLQSDIQKNDIEKIKENSKSYRNACGEYFNILGQLFESLFGSDKKVKKIESELYKNLGFEINFKLGHGAKKFFKPTESECIEYEQKLFNNIINQKTIMANSLDRFEYLLKFHFGDSLGGVVNESVFYKFANKFNRLVNDTKSYNYNPKDFNETLDNIYKTFCEKRRKFKGRIMWNDNLKKLLESYKSFAEDYYNQEVGIVKSIKK